jgi:hypothetical protein
MKSRYAEDLKNATPAELLEAATSWRSTVEGYHLEEIEDACLGEIEFTGWGTDDATVDGVKSDAERAVEILKDAMLDVEEYAKVEILRIKARDKRKVAA